MLRYIELIKDKDIKAYAQHLLSEPIVQECLSKPSTYGGNNHPKDEFVPLGLCLHSMRVCNIALQMYRCYPDANVLEQDLLIVGSLLHDVPHKFLHESGYPNRNHAIDNGDWLVAQPISGTLPWEWVKEIASMVYNHMGKWNSSYDKILEDYPMTRLSWIVHLADNISARTNVIVNIEDMEYLKENLIDE